MEKINYRIPSLDGLRAISIIIVILRHLLSQNYLSPNFEKVPLLFDGQFGVNIFFIISGFLITTLLLREVEKRGSISIRKFYFRRIIRIFPAYFFLMLVYGILSYFQFIEITGKSWVTSLTFTKFLNGGSDWYTWHTWSLSVEEWFYLIWPLLFLQKNRQLVLWLIFIFIPIIKILSYYSLIPHISELSLFTRADAIATGCLFGIYKDRIEVMLFKKNKICKYLLLLIGINILIILSTKINSLNLNALSIGFAGSHGTIANITIGIIIIYSTQIKNNFWYNLLNHDRTVFIGTISYSLYLWQQLFIHDTIKWYNVFPINIILMIMCSLGSYFFIEKSFLKLKNII